MLIRLHKRGEVQTGSGVKIFVDSEFNEMAHISATGEVVLVPDQLPFALGVRTTMDWETEMELKVGDHVVMRRVAVDKALTRAIREGRDQYIFVRYEDCLVARRAWDGSGMKMTRDGIDYSVVMLNGFVLIKLLKKMPNTNLIIPDLAIKNNVQMGMVEYVGSRNKRYQPTVDQYGDVIDPGDADPDMIFPGTTVIFRSPSWAALENPIHATIGPVGGKNDGYSRIQRNRIIAIISAPEKAPVENLNAEEGYADRYAGGDGMTHGFVPCGDS